MEEIKLFLMKQLHLRFNSEFLKCNIQSPQNI